MDSPDAVVDLDRSDETGEEPASGGGTSTVGHGLVGGLVATAVMTLYRLPVFRALAPTAELWARYVGGGDPEQYLPQGIVLHFLYGSVAGGVFAPLLSVVESRTSVARERVAVGTGLAYGLALSLFGTRVLFRHVLEEDLDAEEALVFHVGHAIYGLTLGTWLGTREEYGEVYD